MIDSKTLIVLNQQFHLLGVESAFKNTKSQLSNKIYLGFHIGLFIFVMIDIIKNIVYFLYLLPNIHIAIKDDDGILLYLGICNV